MKLKTYLKRNDEMTATAFAKRAGLAVATITRVIRREHAPRWSTRMAIEEASGGEVRADRRNDWV